MIVESFPVEDDELMGEVEEQTNQQNEKPTLSKSWTEQAVHAPSYSGGKVTLCHSKGTRNLYGYSDEDDESEKKDKLVPFFLAPCAGDLTLIDALHGIKARTIREGCSSSKDTDDDEDESIDTDAIVAYALAPNDCDLITASRNNILRHYDIFAFPSILICLFCVFQWKLRATLLLISIEVPFLLFEFV